MLYEVTVFLNSDHIEVKDDKNEILRIKYNEVKTALFL
ncbi:hypothetical protein DYY67_1348 [Candidatus Nitrosotalea sp. TS]|nr:hypothetical protein [Candidatus Nitrosotalea sp. TS]